MARILSIGINILYKFQLFEKGFSTFQDPSRHVNQPLEDDTTYGTYGKSLPVM